MWYPPLREPRQGETYADLSARVEDDHDDNLGIHLLVDGVAMDTVQIDTSNTGGRKRSEKVPYAVAYHQLLSFRNRSRRRGVTRYEINKEGERS